MKIVLINLDVKIYSIGHTSPEQCESNPFLSASFTLHFKFKVNPAIWKIEIAVEEHW